MQRSKLNISRWTGLCVIILLFCFCPKYLLAQNEATKQDSSHLNKDTEIQYLDPWEYAFMMHEETKWIFKAFLNGYDESGGTKIGFETKLKRSFSINIDGGMRSMYYPDPERDYVNRTSSLFLSLDARWYYRQKKRIRDKKLSANLSDNYISIGYRFSYLDHDRINAQQVYTRWGLQRRFLNNGIVDLGFEFGAFLDKDQNMYQLGNYLNIGLAYAKDKYKLDREKLCPVLRCYAADSYVFKTNFTELISMFLGDKAMRLKFRPEIAFEKKLGQSPFSINTQLSAYLFYNEIYSASYRDFTYKIDALLEARWYYNLKKRIRKGRTGNGLSANYIAVGGLIAYGNTIYNFREEFRNNLHLITGWQRLFGEHLYFDLSIGITYQPAYSKYSYRLEPRIKTAVGYRF